MVAWDKKRVAALVRHNDEATVRKVFLSTVMQDFAIRAKGGWGEAGHVGGCGGEGQGKADWGVGRGRVGGSQPPLHVSIGGGGAALRRKRNFWLFLGAVIRVGRGAWPRRGERWRQGAEVSLW